MERVYAKMFKFYSNRRTWQNLYRQKLKFFELVQICEFNYRLLTNSVPSGKVAHLRGNRTLVRNVITAMI